jgi:peptide/nickel transport system permease protein
VIRIAAKRLLATAPTLILVMLATFMLLELMPGDPAATIAGDQADQATIDRLRTQLGLDEPITTRFGTYLADISTGDLGESLLTGRKVLDSITEALPPTLSLAGVALFIAVVLAFVGGITAALRRNGWVDRLVSALSAVALATPPFVVALLLVVPLAVNRDLFPATGYADIAEGPWEWLRHLLLPGLALSLNSAAELARQIRGAVVDTLEQDFIMTSRASGLSRLSVVVKHTLKNSALPIVTVFGLQVGRILGSAVVVEKVFAIPGFGTLAYSSVLQRDLPMIQGVVLVSAVAVLAVNLLVDLSYPYFNPKLRR